MLPVTLVVWNRPQHTKKTLLALQNCGVEHLLVFQDGDGDSTVTKMILDISWAQVDFEIQPQNRGLQWSIKHAVKKTLKQYEQVILLEDDCLPGPHFMSYMEQCLAQYRDLPSVLGITGYTIPIPPELRKRYKWDVYFYPRSGSWGWATWRDRWTLYPMRNCSSAGLSFVSKDIQRYVELWLKGELDAWTPGWEWVIAKYNMFYVYPTISHIQNIGHDGSGVHCGITNRYQTSLAEQPTTQFPDDIITDSRFYDNFEQVYS